MMEQIKTAYCDYFLAEAEKAGISKDNKALQITMTELAEQIVSAQAGLLSTSLPVVFTRIKLTEKLYDPTRAS
jgi:hypothetical protein